MLCLAEEFSRLYIDVLNQFLTNELYMYNAVHPEEWELIKPNPKEKSKVMMSEIRIALRDTGTCGNCSMWKMSASEVMGKEMINNLDVGMWEPTQGLSLKDDLLPHVTGGLRQRRIKVIATDVS